MRNKTVFKRIYILLAVGFLVLLVVSLFGNPTSLWHIGLNGLLNFLFISKIMEEVLTKTKEARNKALIIVFSIATLMFLSQLIQMLLVL